MRRTNTRKRNKINFKNLDKKAISVIIVLSIFVIFLIFIIVFFVQNTIINKSFEKDYSVSAALNEDNPFWKWSILFDYFKLIFSIINTMNYYNFDTKEF